MDVGNFSFEIPTIDSPSPTPSQKTLDDVESDALEEEEDSDSLMKVVQESGIETEELKRNNFFEKPSSEDVSPMSFASLNLSKPLLKACDALNYQMATPIQAAAIPLILAGRDICGSAITGSGKTAAFGLPLLERLLYRPKGLATIYVLIVAPTRELAVQIHSVMRDLAKFSDIQMALIVGGFSLQVQSATLDTRPEIVVATPGRLIDHLRNSRGFDLDDVHAVVLDEADKLLRMGFIEEIKEILKHLPEKRQTMLFSATMTEEVRKLMQLSLNKPVRIAADPTGRVPRKLKQVPLSTIPCSLDDSTGDHQNQRRGNEKEQRGRPLRSLFQNLPQRTCHHLLFYQATCTSYQASFRNAEIASYWYDAIDVDNAQVLSLGELHSNLSQTERLDALEKFRSKAFAYLVATDVAGRGLDILGVDVVINYDAPLNIDTYLHRIGRTARAGAEGRALTFITDINRQLLREIVRSTKQNLTKRVVPEAVVAYYSQQLQLHQRHLKLVEKEETEKERLDKAEIEAERVVHAIEHEKEIFARPKRTWFQTEAQRKATRRLALLEDQDSTRADNYPSVTKNSKKQKKENRPSQLSNVANNDALKGRVRMIKRLHRMYEAQGSNTKAAMRLANASDVVPLGTKKQKDAEEGFLRDPTELFKARKKMKMTSLGDEERKTRVYAGGQKSHRAPVERRDKRIATVIRRGGKGKHAFKGKRKYKRR